MSLILRRPVLVLVCRRRSPVFVKVSLRDLLCDVFVCDCRGFISCRRFILVIKHKLNVADARQNIVVGVSCTQLCVPGHQAQIVTTSLSQL